MKLKLRVICCLLAAVTLLGAVGCRTSDPAPENTDTTAESRYEKETAAETDPVETSPDSDETTADTTPETSPEGETTPSDPTEEETTPGEEEDPTPGYEVLIMNAIQYETTKAQQKSGDGVTLTLPAEGQTGVQLTAYLKLTETLEDYNYFIVDWGDGTWSYNGPYVYYQQGEVRHTYKKPGTYEVKACAINLELGRRKGWTETQTLVISGEDYAPDNLITKVTPIGGTMAGEEFAYANIADGDNTTKWLSKNSDSRTPDEYVGYLFDDTYTLDTLEIKFPDDEESFPSNISVEYTTDGGKTWYMLPHYYYVLPNSEGVYDCYMNFPNPLGATLVLPMDGIAANGVRLKVMSYGRNGRSFSVEEMRAYGRTGTLFYTSYEGYYNADLTNMWTIFGLAATEPTVRDGNFRAGEPDMCGSLEWAAWDSIQIIWNGSQKMLDEQISAMKNAVYGGDGWYYDEATGTYVVDESEYNSNPRNDGFIWATGGAPKHLDEQNHYTNNSSLIIAARDYLLIATPEEAADFLASSNGRGQVMLDKLRKAMEYMLYDLNGESGLMTIYDPRNDGTVRGLASNYWDSLNFFGYNSAYENIFFYEAVLAMADIETYLGNTAEAEAYVALAARIKTRFNEYFWDPVKGRYITSVNVKGDVLDFGLTVVNFMAVAAGLASTEQAQLIYDWVDGKRIIEGDNSTGEDIYNFKVSARTNTVAVETIEEDGLHYWWYNGHGFNDVIPGHWGQYGQQMQNGGTIFYISYYDVVGRNFLSTDLAAERFSVIMDEFHIDSLRRDPRTKWGPYLVSINGEFPESGLVPATFVTQVVGVFPDVAGLRIEAGLPSDMTYAGVREYHYNGLVYHILVDKTLTEPSMTLEDGVYFVKLPADKAYYITRENTIVEAEESSEEPSVTVGAPVVTPAELTVNVDELSADLILAVDYNGGAGLSLTCNGTPVDKADYVRSVASLTLREAFVKTLPLGENSLEITTDKGSATVKLIVEREGVIFTDPQRIKTFEGEDVCFSVDLGSGVVEAVTLNGDALSEDAFLCENGVLRIRKEFLSTLPVGAYEVILYGAYGTYVDCYVAVGVAASEVFVVNFDSFRTTGGQLSSFEEVEGRNGLGGRVAGQSTQMILELGEGAAPYEFVHGGKYAATLYLKTEDLRPETSMYLDMYIPIRFYWPAAGAYADIVYLRYNEQDGCYVNQAYATAMEWTREGDWNRLYFEFTYNEAWETLTFPTWMQGSFVLDSFTLVRIG